MAHIVCRSDGKFGGRVFIPFDARTRLNVRTNILTPCDERIQKHRTREIEEFDKMRRASTIQSVTNPFC